MLSQGKITKNFKKIYYYYLFFTIQKNKLLLFSYITLTKKFKQRFNKV